VTIRGGEKEIEKEKRKEEVPICEEYGGRKARWESATGRMG